jgi:hypothetical protein
LKLTCLTASGSGATVGDCPLQVPILEHHLEGAFLLRPVLEKPLTAEDGPPPKNGIKVTEPHGFVSHRLLTRIGHIAIGNGMFKHVVK